MKINLKPLGLKIYKILQKILSVLNTIVDVLTKIKKAMNIFNWVKKKDD